MTVNHDVVGSSPTWGVDAATSELVATIGKPADMLAYQDGLTIGDTG